MGNMQRAEQNNGIDQRVLENHSWKGSNVVTICQLMAGWSWGHFEMSYWWDCSWGQRIQIWPAGSLWVCVTLEHEWALNLFVSLVLFLSAIFLSPAICYKLPRARNNKNRSFHLPLRQPAVIVWCWHSGLSNPENFVGILTLFTSRVNTVGVQEQACLPTSLQD